MATEIEDYHYNIESIYFEELLIAFSYSVKFVYL
jgi:hypothetical protein